MNSAFFAANRRRLTENTKGGLTILTAYTSMQRSADMAFAFEQEANFWYITGIAEPDWWVIIDGQRNKTWLVVPHIDDVHKIFDGSLSKEDALRQSGANEIIEYDRALSLLRDLAKKHSIVHTLGEHPHKDHFNFIENPAQRKLTAILERTFNSVQDCRKELSKLRAIKQPVEITAMKKAIRLTTDAFEAVQHKLSELNYEYEVEAEFDYFFKKHAVSHAYDPIVAVGKNACTLHYTKNNSPLQKKSLLLMDIGAKYGGYSADITRTYAIDKPSPRQIAVHDAVERSHQAIIKLIKPGFSVREYHEKVDEIMKHALMELGLMKNMDDEAYRTYFPHAVSHGLGIDPHDPLGAPEVFEEGMILTVEPGIYIPEENIGIRIEDDILVTKTGRSNLSGHLSTGLV